MLVQHRPHLRYNALVDPIKDKISYPNVVATRGLSRQTRQHSLSGDALRLAADFKLLFPVYLLDLLTADLFTL